MKVSVIIPTYNEEKDIEDCLFSLDNQTLKNFEVIVVDDGSKDKTYNKVKKFRNSKFEIRIYRQDHQGPAVARNRGAKHARGNILVFVDADMAFDKDFLKNLIKPIELSKVVGTFSKEEYVSNWENPWSRSWNYMEGWDDEKRHRKNHPSTQKVFRAIKKDAFERTGGFSKGGYTDDYSLYDKLGEMAQAAKDAKFYHRNPDSLFEIFHHAKWVGKRKYKFGMLGYVVGIIRASLPVSLLVGLFRSIKHKNVYSLPFQIVYDHGVFWGIIEYALLRKNAK